MKSRSATPLPLLGRGWGWGLYAATLRLTPLTQSVSPQGREECARSRRAFLFVLERPQA